MLTGEDLNNIKMIVRKELHCIVDEQEKRIEELFSPTPEFKEKQLRGLACALYRADLDATDPQLGRPVQTWEELTEGERITYLRYARAAIAYLQDKEQ